MPQDGNLGLVRKAVELLDQLAAAPGATAAELARRMDEPRSSIYRLLSSLQALDMVQAGSRRGTFQLGFHLLRLGSAVASRFDERRAALPVMERIHDETGETIFFCVRRGSEAVCIERIDGRHVQVLELQLGGSLPLHVGAAPRALLAFEPPEAWSEYLDEAAEARVEPVTPSRRQEIFSQLEAARRDGMAISDEDVTVGVAAIGVPVLDYQGKVRGALSISGVQRTILGANFGAIREMMLLGGEEISRALGGHLADEAVVDLG